MIPKETKCKYCGRPVLFVPGPRGLLCVEASLTPYRFRRAAESSDDMVTLYTNSGTPLPVIECEEDEMCGAAHKFHFCPNKKREENEMSRSKAMFITTMVMALLAAVIYFVWRYGRGFGIIEAMFALYGYASFAADICRWMRLPDAAILQRGGRHG